MATVSEGIGMKEMNSTSTFLKQLAIILAQAIKNGKRNGYRDEHRNGARAILKHINNGGKVSYQRIDLEDVALFEKILQNKRIPYVKLNDWNGKSTLVTRDIDNKLVEQTVELFSEQLKIGFTEQAPQDFLHNHVGQTIGQSLSYTEAELEVFRKEAAAIGFTYAVVGNEKEKGKYDILYSKRDKDAVAKALKGIEYEFSGDDGVVYQKAIEESIAIKNSILKASKEKPNEMIYIVNAKNPMQFLTIEHGIMIEHNLSIQEKKGRNGQIEKFIKDKSVKTNPFGNRELTQAMKKLGECIIVPKEVMSFISGFDSANNVIVADLSELSTALNKMEKDIAAKVYLCFSSMVTRNGSTSFEKVHTLTDIPTEDMLKLMEELNKENIDVIVVGNDLAFKEKDKITVEQVLDKTIYHGMNFMERWKAMVYYEGRGLEGMNLENLSEPVYIISAKNPEYVLKLDNIGYSLLQNGETVMELGRAEPKFGQQLEAMIHSMEDIAVISEKEAKRSPEERVKIIEERISIKENEASRQYYRTYKEKKEQFLNSDLESMSLTDREIMKRYMAHKIEFTYIDRTFTERVMDKEFNNKIKEKSREITRMEKSLEQKR